MKFNLAIMLMVSSFLNCAEMSEQEKKELAQKQIVQAGHPGGVEVVQQVAKQLDKNEIIRVLNKAKKIVWKDEELVNFIENIINRVKKDKLAKGLRLLKFIEEDSEYKEDSKETQIINEMQMLFNNLSSNVKFKYLKPDELIEFLNLTNSYNYISIAWSKCSQKLFCINLMPRESARSMLNTEGVSKLIIYDFSDSRFFAVPIPFPYQ